tara:strand:- start:4365 stop:4631 length:267 start_codon:yes stop_codon:yes gene_type:complete
MNTNTLECDSCGCTLHGDSPHIVITCNDCIAEKEMFENMSTEDRLSEVISWITEDCWAELSQESKARIIRQLDFMGISTESLVTLFRR